KLDDVLYSFSESQDLDCLSLGKLWIALVTQFLVVDFFCLIKRKYDTNGGFNSISIKNSI
ncbi:unnamed protein product, partial [Brassica rapa]